MSFLPSTSYPASCNEFERESNSVLHDYEALAAQVHAIEADRDHFKSQHDKSLSELRQKSERIHLIEGQRSSTQERLNHMDAQVRACGVIFVYARNLP